MFLTSPASRTNGRPGVRVRLEKGGTQYVPQDRVVPTAHKSVVCCHSECFVCDLSFSDVDLMLLKDLVSRNRSIRSAFKHLGAKWGVILSKYHTVLPATVKPKYLKMIAQLRGDMCETCFISVLKEVGRLNLQRMIQRGVDDALYFLDLHVLGGYDTTLNRVDPMSTLREEFCVSKNVDLSPRMKYWIRDTIDKISFKNVGVSFKQFVRFRDAWCNPGASTLGNSAKIAVKTVKNGKEYVKKFSLRNKWFKALGLSDEIIEKKAREGAPALVKPFRKLDEPAKARTVQAFDTLSLLRSSYMSLAIDKFNGRGLWTTMEMSAGEKMQVRRKLLRRDGLVRVCTDQSSFDINQSKESVLYSLHYLFKRMVKFGRHDDLGAIAEAELRSIDKAYLNSADLPWRKGVLSGMKYTALVDSILNRAASMLVAERLGVKVTLSLFQGDDAVMIVDKLIDPNDLASHYSDLGLEVNPHKTWVARDRCEFLHEIYSDGVVRAFPARAFRGILWRKPQTGPKIMGAMSIQEELGIAQTCARRGLCNMYSVIANLITRVGGKLKSSELMEVYNTPAALGGLGFGSGGRMRMEVESVKRRKHRVSVDSYVGVNWGHDLVMNAVLQRASGVVSLPGYVTKIFVSKVRTSSEMEPRMKMAAVSAPHVRLEWSLSDYSVSEDPYVRKLVLEHKLVSRDKIVPEDIPMRLFDGVPDFDDAVRYYNRMVRRTVSIADGVRYWEAYAGIARWCDVVWAGICSLASVRHIDRRFTSKLHVELISSLWSLVRWYRPLVDYQI